MQTLTEHERKVFDLVRRYPEIVRDRSARERVATRHGITEKTLRNRIADLKRYGMIQMSPGQGTGPGILDKEVATLFDFSRVIWKRRRLIMTNVIVVSLVAVIVSLAMPKTYRSSAVLMPPASESGLGIMGALSNLPFGGFVPKAGDSETMNFLAILKSRTAMENVIDRFDLVEFYEVESVEDAVDELMDNVNVEIDEEGTIRISSDVTTGWFHRIEEEEKCKKLSADMANYFVANLDVVNKRLKTEKARFQRLFIEERYKQNMKDLKEAEENLRTFQEVHNMISLPEQTRAAIEAAATIKAQILANEVKLGVMTNTLSPDHPEVERIQVEIEELQSQLMNMDYGTTANPAYRDSLFPFFSEVPDLGVQLARLQREVEIQNTLFTFLTQQYEEAKIQEARDTPTVQILDEAVIPEKKIKPKRALIVVTSSLIALLSSIFLAAASEYVRKNRETV